MFSSTWSPGLGQGLGVLCVLAPRTPMRRPPWKCGARQAPTIGFHKSQAGAMALLQIHAQKYQFRICSQLRFHHVGAGFSLGPTSLWLQEFQMERLALGQADGRGVLPSTRLPPVLIIS